MKFYFCETCGKRLTERDIEGGDARDKKLKGVYCSACSVGVTTMDTLPMSETDAEKLLEQESRPARPSSQMKPARSARKRPSSRSSSARIESGRRAADAIPRLAEGHRVLLVVSIAVVLALVTSGFVVMGMRGGKVAPAANKTSFPGTLDEDAREVAGNGKARVIEPSSVEAVSREDNKRETTDHSTAKPAPTKSPLPVTPASSRTRAVDRSAASTPPGEPKPVAVVAPPPTPQKKRELTPLERARAKLGTHLDPFETAIRAANGEAMIRISKKARDDPELRLLDRELKELVTVAGILTEVEADRQKALTSLTDGTKRTLVTSKRKVTGIIRKFEAGVLHLKVEGRINKQIVEYEKTVRVEELTPESHARLFPQFSPSTPEEWLAKGMRHFAQGELDASEKTLGRATKLALTACYRERIERAHEKAREVAASRNWDDLLAAAAKKEWKRVVTGLGRFQEDHGNTQFAAGKVKEAARLMETAEPELARIEGRLFKFETKTDFERFQSFFTSTSSGQITMQHEPGKVVFGGQAGVIALRSKALFLGPSWDLAYTFRIHSSKTEQDGPAKRKELGINICFKKPETHLKLTFRAAHRFQFNHHPNYGNYIYLRGPGQYPNGRGSPGLFQGAKLGPRYRALSRDGRYKVKLAMRNGRFVAVTNDNKKQRIETAIPAAAQDLMVSSSVTILVYRMGPLPAFELEEFFFRQVEAE